MFYFHPYLGKPSNLTNIFQMGWNHQLVIHYHFVDLDPLCFFKKITKTSVEHFDLGFCWTNLRNLPEEQKMRNKHAKKNSMNGLGLTKNRNLWGRDVVFGRWAETKNPASLLYIVDELLPSYMGELFHKPLSGWWFQICLIVLPIWGRFPFRLIFVKWVETTN